MHNGGTAVCNLCPMIFFTCHFPHLGEKRKSTHSCITVVNSRGRQNFGQFGSQEAVFIARGDDTMSYDLNFFSSMYCKLTNKYNIFTFSHFDTIPCPTDICVWIFSIHSASDVECRALFDLLPQRLHGNALWQP